MENKYKKQRDEMNRVIYNNKTLSKLKKIGKKKGLLNVDQYKKEDKNVLIERLIKGKQLSDESKKVLLEKAQNEGLLVNASMDKNVILQKNNKTRTQRFKRKTIEKNSGKQRYPIKNPIDKQGHN